MGFPNTFAVNWDVSVNWDTKKIRIAADNTDWTAANTGGGTTNTLDKVFELLGSANQVLETSPSINNLTAGHSFNTVLVPGNVYKIRGTIIMNFPNPPNQPVPDTAVRTNSYDIEDPVFPELTANAFPDCESGTMTFVDTTDYTNITIANYSWSQGTVTHIIQIGTENFYSAQVDLSIKQVNNNTASASRVIAKGRGNPLTAYAWQSQDKNVQAFLLVTNISTDAAKKNNISVSRPMDSSDISVRVVEYTANGARIGFVNNGAFLSGNGLFNLLTPGQGVDGELHFPILIHVE